MTDNLAVGRITYPPIERREWIFVVPPDPRDAEIADLQRWLEIKQNTANGAVSVAKQYQHDLEVAQARIAELEKVLRDIRTVSNTTGIPLTTLKAINIAADCVLMYPERDMTITQEEFDA